MGLILIGPIGASRFPLPGTTDIVHWLALETSLAAVADAGYAQDSLPGRQTGVIIGNTLTGEQTRANTMRLRWPFVRRALGIAARGQGLDDGQIRLLTQAPQGFGIRRLSRQWMRIAWPVACPTPLPDVFAIIST